MDWLQAILLAFVQGVTEFLPISSSGHLILPAQLFGWEDQGLAFDVAVHVGSLAAVGLYFRQELISMTTGCFASIKDRKPNDDSRLVVWVVVGTIPACVVGLLCKDLIEEHLRTVLVIATTTILFGLLLGLADRKGTRQWSIQQLSMKAALVVGVAQCLALIPGTSRSGITITAALLLGFSREASARYSFLLSIPLILASGLIKTIDLLQMQTAVPWAMIGGAMVVSALSAYACIHLFLKWIDQVGMMPFVIYRIALGALLFAFVWI